MGDFSRDTFKLTNVLHQLVTGETVSSPRHYVGVRLQQGVPILDADWRELEDIRRFELQENLREFFGEGVPDGNGGFKIGSVTEGNDFFISPGVALVNGMLVVNHYTDLTYIGQQAVFGVSVATLAPPIVGTRNDLVYLDVWEDELNANCPERGDDRLTNPIIGIDACTRIERRWVVRVKTNATSLDEVAKEEGHSYMVIGGFVRFERQDRIQQNYIDDRRRTGLNVAKYLKIPVFVERGSDIVDSDKMAVLLGRLQKIFFDRLEQQTLFVPLADNLGRTLLNFTLSHIHQACITGSMQARTRNLTNSDALEVLAVVRDAQNNFLDVLEVHGDGTHEMSSFITTYRVYLAGNAGLNGIDPHLAEGDLIGAYKGQQVLNAWLSAPGGSLPEGDVLIQYVNIDPQPDTVDGLQAGLAYNITVEILSRARSDQGSEVFDVRAEISSSLWEIDPSIEEITLDNEGGTGMLEFTIVPNAGNVRCLLTVTAEARNNPAVVKSPENELLLEIGEAPDIGAILLLAAPPDMIDEFNRLRLNAALLNAGLAGVPVALYNRTDDDHVYTLQYTLALDSGESRETWRDITLPAQSMDTITIFFALPEGVSAAVDDEGSIEVTLTGIDAPPDLPEEQKETVNKHFILI